MNTIGNVAMPKEQLAFLVSHICQGFPLSYILPKFNDRFSKDLRHTRCESLLGRIDDQSKRALLAAAPEYEWFNPKFPQYYDFSLPCIVRLSSVDWSMEQRAYILHFRARGISPNKIFDEFSERYQPQRTKATLSHQLTYLEGRPDLAQQLKDESSKFVWWRPEPVRGDKEWAAMNRRSKQVEARRRQQAHDNLFKGIEEGASAAAAREEEQEENIFGTDDQEGFPL
ncbi:hypothetical protein MMC07_002470 [Pseudocyphellaria aurata]|nr:hypothetical protein [Pseudocyphellaria aurata]